MLDSTDKQLLRLLQVDAALSVADLAERVSISKSARVGLGLTVFITIRTNQHNEAWVQRFREVVQGVEGVLEVYRLGGQLDYLLKAVVADMPDYDRLYQQLIAADLFDVSASFVMEEIKATTVLPV